jgi:hypothetical protein
MADVGACPADCLHCAINDLVLEHARKDDPVDVTDIASRMAESIADLLLFAAPPEEQPRLMAHTLQHLGWYLLAKSGAIEPVKKRKT